MRERVQQIWGRVRDFFKNMKKGLKIGLAAGAAALVLLIVILSIVLTRQPYVVLFGGLNPEDMTAVVTYLDAAGVKDLKIQNDDTVLVRESQADRLRAAVIQQGFPTSGYSHDTYLNNISALSSSADRQQLALYDLQDSLAATIRFFDGVSDANVIITPGEDHRYILDENVTQATAGVFVQMKSGKSLTKEQVAAIQRLVASAEKGLTISNVTVEDGAGNRYNAEPDLSDVLDETMKRKLALEAQVNEQVRNSVMNVFVPYFGLDNVQVSVHSTVDVTRTYSESTVYHEPAWAEDGSSNGRGIIGSQVWDNSSVFYDDQTAGGVVGTTTNTEINEYITNPDELTGNEREWIRSGEIQYNVSHDNIQRESSPGTITDLTVAIAVNSAKVNLQNPASFVHLAATAAGITPDMEAEKVAIVSFPFYQSNVAMSGGSTGEVTTIMGLPAWAVYAAIAGVALFLALLLIILLLRSKKKKRIALMLAEEQRLAEEAAAAEEAARLAAEAAAAADIMDVHTEESMQMRQDVRQFVEENPSIAAQMIKNWLRGETDSV